MIRKLVVAAILFSAIVALAISQPSADGCAAIPRKGEPYIRIAEESAIIVWNSTKKLQHFIRRASFDTKSPDFGFLVPTPQMPQTPFDDVEDFAFSAAQSWMTPKIVTQQKLNFAPLLCGFFTMSKNVAAGRAEDMTPKSSVKVLHEQKVGGFDVKVVEADNTEDLSTWLKEHNYSNDPELQSWLAPYVADKWKITAFKIAQNPESGQLAQTKAVRMSFKTEKPFFPYREPEKKQKNDDKQSSTPDPRLLRVLFVSDVRMAGTRGNGAWHASVPWSDTITEEQRKLFVANTKLKDEDVPAKVWLTSFEDRESPRPGTEEVYFEPAKDQTPIRPEVIRFAEIWIPADIVIFVVIVVFVFLAVLGVVWKKCRAA